MKLDNETQRQWLLHVIEGHRIEGNMRAIQDQLANLQALAKMVADAEVEEALEEVESK